MNVLPGTWAFKIKRFLDGLVRKLKSRWCCHGDRQVKDVDFFDTCAPVVKWTAVRSLLILTAQLALTTKQVDHTAAFVHADIDEPPNCSQMTPDEQSRVGALGQAQDMPPRSLHASTLLCSLPVDNSMGVNLDEPMRTLGTSTRNI